MWYIKKLKKRRRRKSRDKARRVSRIPGYTTSTGKKFGKTRIGTTSKKRARSDRSRFRVRVWLWWVFVLLPLVVLWVRFYRNVVRDLPDIADIENADFSQTTVITDRNGVDLYKLYEENRDYIPYTDISENFVNAIVATEDQRFRDNPWVDWKGIIRAWIADISSGWKSLQWWSTITQQVIKNILLTPEKKITRKLKEIILAVKLVDYVRNDVSKKYDDLSNKEIDRKMKEEILELYANYIFLGNNSYGIEIASQTYFGVSAKNLTPLQWAILAGIPQAPSRYDPYGNRGLLMWEVIIEDPSAQDLETPAWVSDTVKNQVISEMKTKINDANLGNKRNDSKLLSFVEWLLEYETTIWGKEYQINYELWRKDAVLGRMYEMWYLTEDQLKESLSDALDLEFNREPVSIKAPHFVFRVIKQLEQEYEEEVLRTWWLKIKTTLDYDIQKLAEQAIKENAWHYNGYNAYNSSLVYTDSLNGDILAYVGSRDYNNDDIDGQVDMIQSLRQPWSIIKPFVYSLWFMNLKLTIDSPIYDIALKIWNNEPQNADGKFWWLTTIRQALAGSRNIPAIKMFLSAWWEPIIKDFLNKLWMTNLIMDRDHYGYALWLWAAETPMLEMANAYAHLSAMWKPAKINPIMEVRWADGTILYEKKVETQEQVIPGWVAYLLRNILSSKENFPEDWRANFTIPGLDIATKSGTTNVVQGELKLPRDWRLASYTPSKVLVMRWWNTDGSAMRSDAFGWWLNSPTRKSFLNKLKNQQYIINESMEEREVKQISISKLSGKLSGANTPLVFMKNSLWYIYSLPTEYDNQVSSYQVDTLCNGKPTELTPPDSLATAWYVRPETFMPDKFDQDDVITRWANGWWAQFGGNYSLKPWPWVECEERLAIAELGEISINLMQPVEWQWVTRTFSLRHQTDSPFTITDMKLYLWDIELETINYNKWSPVIDVRDVTLPTEIEDGTYVLKAVIRDEKGYSDSRSVRVKVWSKESDTTPPYLIDDKISVTANDDGSYGIVLLFGDEWSSIWDGTLSMWWKQIFTFKGNIANFTIWSVWSLAYKVYDTSGNLVEWTIVLQAPPGSEPAPDPVEPEPVEPEEAPTQAPSNQEEIPDILPIWADQDTLGEEEIAEVVNNLFPGTEPN